MFFLAMPKEEGALDALQSEAGEYGDMELEPHTSEGYLNVTHQTLDIFRAAIVDRSVTHVLKVSSLAPVHPYVTGFPIQEVGALQQTFYGRHPTCPLLFFLVP